MNIGIIAGSRLRGAPFVGFLNEFSGASFGLSLELLDGNYNGNCIRVRRSSDDTELDIGFVNGLLDTASLLDFVGSGNGFVSIIYDQVGSNNMVQNTASLQGQIVSNGSVILKGGKPCIIRSLDNDGGYLSTYNTNGGVEVKGMFYVGSSEGKKAMIFGSLAGGGGGEDYGFASDFSSSTNIDGNPTIFLTNFNGVISNLNTRQQVLNATTPQFLLYREIIFDFTFDNQFGLSYRRTDTQGFGMYTFQELVLFENTDDADAKENNINTRYNIY